MTDVHMEKLPLNVMHTLAVNIEFDFLCMFIYYTFATEAIHLLIVS